MNNNAREETEVKNVLSAKRLPLLMALPGVMEVGVKRVWCAFYHKN